ncbi:sensor histidine kinase [Allorhizobium undicola]|uniref:sensor histidine kinase n=1 Tax=Allorhizobium undicola TaxID=78527 RepID=UPI0004821188|nr:CHASE3 domain-containing protein [Allorhizobium undicola]
MSATHRIFMRSTMLMLALGALILFSIIASSIWLLGRTQDMFDVVVQERQVRRTIADLLQNLTDAETGQRGYIITQQQDFLRPYTDSVGDVRNILANLDKQMANQPERARQLPQLHRLVDAKLGELEATLNLARIGRIQESVDAVRGGFGKNAMDEIRQLLETMRDTADISLDEGIAAQKRASNWLTWFTLGGAIAIVAVLGGALAVIIQHVRELSQARQEVELLNRGLEARVQERTEDLIQANQEIQRFAYIVTHDLRAPLVNVMGFTAELDTALKSLQAYVLSEGAQLSEQQIADARLAASEDLPEAIGFIRSSTRKMDGLINAILKISRDGRRQLKPEPVSLNEILQTTAASVQHQIGESGGKVDISIDVDMIVSDRLSIEQILGNLFDNAIKYRRPEIPLNLAARTVQDGRHFIRIDIKDNGRGIAAEDHERIFELFRRSGQQDQRGEGIGLAHVRSLARNLGGEITVTSQLGAGSTFTLRLPRDLSKLVRSET